jgi:two-component system, cell cycle sensor histidine kinase and response regulator CckA
MKTSWTAQRIALIYALFSTLWIVGSDRVVGWLAPNLSQALLFQTIKGLFFVLASALLVYLLVRDAERKLRQNEAQLALLFETMFDMFTLQEVICDDHGKPIDFRFLTVNPAVEKLLGRPAETIVGRTVRGAMPGVEQAWIDKICAVGLSGVPDHFTEYNAGLDIWLEVSAYSPVRGQVATLSRDVTARFEADRARWRDEKRLRLALAGAELGMWDWSASRNVTYDDRWAQMLGYRLADIGTTDAAWLELIHPEALPRVLEVRNAHLRGESPSYTAEYRMRHADGHWVWILAKGKVIERDDAGRPLRACGTHLDISERKRADEERAQLEAQLRQAQKMEAIGQLAGGVAHDFNNLLQVINGYAELAACDIDPEHAASGPVREIAKAGRRAAGLVAQLLAFSRRQVLEPEDLDLNDVVAGLLSMLERLIGEHIELDFQPGPGLRTVVADRGMIEQVILNLCVNSRDAMPTGGKLLIETHLVESLEHSTSVALPANGRYVMLAVSDDGCGMDRATLERVFDPFFSTKPPGAGTGLGLATVYGIVKQHEGMIRAESMPGQGSTFRVYLPVGAQTEMKDAAPSTTEVGGGRETILLAEDDAGVRQVTQRILEKAGYRVLVAESGNEAIATFHAHIAEIDLLLLDVVMPGLNGAEVCEQARRERPELPVIYASGYSDAAPCRAERGIEFIYKPFGRDDLLRAVRDVLDTRRIDPKHD